MVSYGCSPRGFEGTPQQQMLCCGGLQAGLQGFTAVLAAGQAQSATFNMRALSALVRQLKVAACGQQCCCEWLLGALCRAVMR